MKKLLQIFLCIALILIAYFFGKKSNKVIPITTEPFNAVEQLESIEDINPYDIYSIKEDSVIKHYAIDTNVFHSDNDSIEYADIETGEKLTLYSSLMKVESKTIEKNGYKFRLILRRDQSKRCRGGGINNPIGGGKYKTWYHAELIACKDGKYPQIKIGAAKACGTPLIVDYPMLDIDFASYGLVDCGIGGNRFRLIPKYKTALHFTFVQNKCSYDLSRLSGLEFRIKYEGDSKEYSFKPSDFYPNLKEIIPKGKCIDNVWKTKSLELLKEENPRIKPRPKYVKKGHGTPSQYEP